MTIEVLRGGLTSPTWSGRGRDITLSANSPDRINTSFKIASKGGGTTLVEVRIYRDSFEAVAIAMMKADSKTAMKAFGAALQVD